MLERSPRENVLTGTPSASLNLRRLLFFLAVLLTMAGLIWLAVIALSPSGFGAVDLVLVLLFAVTLPWYVIGFWNATIGLLIMRFARDPVAAVTPAAGRIRDDEPITTSTAIVMCIRNELPDRVLRHLTPLMQGIAARGAGDHFHVYVLSDTDDPATAAAEDACFATLAGEWRDKLAITYRRRDKNTGFKAGNVRDFCERWGQQHDFALMLDADSLMTADAVAAPGAHHAGDPQDRHSAEPGDRHAVGKRVRAHFPVRHAARHALLHHRQCVVARRLRPVLGPQRAGADRALRASTATCRCSRKTRWSAATCSAMTRSRRC